MQNTIPEYQCHKKVRAFEIGKIEGTLIFPKDEDLCPPFDATAEFIKKHPLNLPGYIVFYEDGYASFSPKSAFEAGYSGSGSTEILMSRGNPEGHKLEDLLDAVIRDIEVKTSLIKDKTGFTEQTITQHNQVVIGHLKAAAATQRLTYILLEERKGEDKGVEAPRI